MGILKLALCLSLNPKQVTSRNGGPRVPPAGRGAASGAGSEGSSSRGGGCAPDHKQPGALGASELFKNKCNPVPTLRRTNFPSRNCYSGCLMFFIKTTTLYCFPLISMMTLMGNLSTGTVPAGCSWRINKELNLEQED